MSINIQVKNTYDPDGNIRLQAIYALGRLGDKTALPALERLALSDSYERMIVTGFGGVSEYPSHHIEYNRDDACRAMVSIYHRHGITDAEIGRLITELGSSEWPSAGWLAGTLLRELHARTLPALAAALDHPREDVRAGVAYVLYALRDVAPTELEQALTHGDATVRAIALRGLLRHGAHLRDLPRLTEMLADPAASVRVVVLEHCYTADLMQIASEDAQQWFPQVIALLEQSLADPDDQVRLRALEGITRSQPGSDPRPGLRSLQLLQRYQYQPRPNQLLPLLTDSNPQIQVQALKATRRNPYPLRRQIEQLLRSEQLQVSLAAADVLANAKLLDTLSMLRIDLRPELRRFAARSLAYRPPPFSGHLAWLLPYAALLRKEVDGDVKHQVMQYVHKNTCTRSGVFSHT